MVHNDDVTIGRVLSRREVLGLLGGAGGAVVLGATAGTASAAPAPFRLPACIVRPSQTEGPYFLDDMLRRSDIRSEPADGSVCEGTMFSLGFQVSRINASGCVPLPGAVVDVWQCDALGVYSGVKDISDQFDTTGKQFLRGHQITDRDGMAQFNTIYPGWYQGRTVHIHFKIRTNPADEKGHEFTSQLYFDDSFTDRVLAAPAYAKPGRRPRNTDDGLYRGGGDQLILAVKEAGPGLTAVFDVGLQID